jgi:hypothetical protein
MTKEKIVLDDLTDDKACAVEQMYKRMIWGDFERLSANAAEHNHMDRATHKLRRALAKRTGPGCLNRISAALSGASAGVRLPRGTAAG